MRRWPTISPLLLWRPRNSRVVLEMGTVNTHASHFCLTPWHCARTHTRLTHFRGRETRARSPSKVNEGLGGKERERERERDLLLCSGQHSRLHGDERGPPRPVYAPDLPPSFKWRLGKTRSRHRETQSRKGASSSSSSSVKESLCFRAPVELSNDQVYRSWIFHE